MFEWNFHPFGDMLRHRHRIRVAARGVWEGADFIMWRTERAPIAWLRLKKGPLVSRQTACVTRDAYYTGVEVAERELLYQINKALKAAVREIAWKEEGAAIR